MTESSESPPVSSGVRYKHPKILALDLSASVTERLQDAGYNVRRGTFGRPYKVPKRDGFLPVVAAPSLPNYAEQEVVLIDLAAAHTAQGPEAEKVTSAGEADWYATTSTGIIDPRPRVMTEVREYSDRILTSGGAFVVFATERAYPQMVRGRQVSPHSQRLEFLGRIEEDNWSFLSILSSQHLRVPSDYGTEIKVSEGPNLLSSFLRRHLANSTFNATLHPTLALAENPVVYGSGWIFVPLASNKFGESVAGVLVPRKRGNGWVLILPQLEDKTAAILDLIQTVLPELLPSLFPHYEGGRWVHREEYEHPSVLERRTAQLEAQRKANEEVARLEQEIEAERDRLAFLHGLLTKSGDALVADVKRTLEFIGFHRVVNVDEASEAGVNKQEDLQILDTSPSLVVEVKGLAGMPREDDTLQVTKFVLRRIRQWDRNDVNGVSLINHQRNLPALERNHDNVFTEQQIRDAELNGTGLMTTWDLFRLIRGMIRWKWSPETVREILYGKGRLQQHPTHYTRIGTVAHYWTEHSAISIDVIGPLRVGDRVGYLLADGYFEEEVPSLQVEKKPVQEATPPVRAGMKTTLTRKEIPVGTPVFAVGTGVESLSEEND